MKVVYLTDNEAKSALWMDEKFSRGQAYLDLIYLANNKTCETVYNFKKKIFRRGCIYRSNNNLAERWKWSSQKVNTFLNQLCDTNRIKINGKGLTREIEIKNYGNLQGTVNDVSDDESYINIKTGDDEEETEKDTEEDTGWFDRL